MQSLGGKEKEFTLSDDKGVRQVLIRAKNGVYFSDVYAKSLEDQTTTLLFEGSASLMVQDSKGKWLVVSSPKKVVVVDLTTRKKVYQSAHTYVHYVAFSPAERYLQIFDKHDANKGETIILSVPDFKQVATFKEGMNTNFIVKQAYPLAKFTLDDKLVFRYISKVMEIYDTTEFKQVDSIETDFIKFFEVSKVSTIDNFFVVTVVLDEKTNKGKMTIYNQKSLKGGNHFYVKNIEKAEEVKIKFNPTADDFLIEVQTYFDATGKSYYGEYGLYFFNSKDKKLGKVRTYEGPIHDFSWDPLGSNFIVISGFMPANSVLFNNKNEPVLEFGKHHRNLICWNPQGRFVCLAGYGNLNGEMEVWDIKDLKKIGICTSNSASYCSWSPDGRKMLTAVVTPRLRVDNDYKIFSYSGSQLHTLDLSQTELYDVIWKNTDFFKQDNRGASPGRKLLNEKKEQEKKFFRPPGSSNLTNALLKGDTTTSNEPRILTKHEKFEISRAPTNAPQIMNQFPAEEEKPKKKKKKKNTQGV